MVAMRHRTVTVASWAEGGGEVEVKRAAGSPLPGHRGRDPRQRALMLRETIETQIVPRLVLALGADPFARTKTAAIKGRLPDDLDVARFIRLVLADDLAAVVDHVQFMLRRGATPEALCVEFLTPAAHELERLWRDDLCDFAQFTLGMWLLSQVLHAISATAECQRRSHSRSPEQKALLVSVAGGPRTFSLAMVVAHFQHAGWEVRSGSLAAFRELVSLVGREWFGVVGFLLVGEDRAEGLVPAIRAIRRASCNPAISVLVVGRARFRVQGLPLELVPMPSRLTHDRRSSTAKLS